MKTSSQKIKKVKKQENKPKIKYRFEPMSEEHLEKSIKLLSFLWAQDMGWVPKELSKKEK